METNIIYNTDCINGIKENINEESVDLIITDPPFAIDFKAKKANYNREEETVIDDYFEIKKEDYYLFNKSWMTEAKRILKDTGSMYVFSGWNHLEDILRSLRELDFKTINHIIWKYQFGVNCTKKYITSHYHILYVAQNPKKVKFFPFERFKKGEKTNTKKEARYDDMEDVWVINRENWTGMIKTPTKLPGEIIKKILQYSSEENDLVCDPFSGSGQVAWFCKEMNRQYICFEKSKEIYDFSNRRIEENKYLLKEKKGGKICPL